MTDTAPGRPALVTGATGFLGAHLAGFLHRQGWKVRALARATSNLSRLQGQGQGVEIVQGDVTAPETLVRAMQGQEVVFHSAARVGDWGPREEFLRVNRDGTAHALAAARQAGVRRFVHLSSLTVLGLPRDGALVTEDSPYATGELDTYTESKLAAERLAREAHGAGLEVTVVRPGVIWGPGDPNILPRIIDLLRRRRMVYVDGGRNHIALSHVENLSHGLALAARAPAAAGRVYHLIDGAEMTARQAIDGIAGVLGLPTPRISLPFPVVYGVAALLEAGGWALRRKAPPAMTRYGVRLVACDCRYDMSRARQELGYEPILTFLQGVAGLADPTAAP